MTDTLRFGALRCLVDLVSDGPFVVTFSNWHPEGVEHQAFGRSFIRAMGVNAAHVVAGESDWFTGDPAALEQAFGAITSLDAYRRAPVRMGYGSSMGGYAALRHRRALGLDRVLAYCPQYSIDPAHVGFETRWARERERHGPGCAGVDPVAAGDDVTIVYDPSIAKDAAHVRLIDPDALATRVALPFSAHPPMPFLAELKALGPMFAAVLRGEDAAGVAGRAWRERHRSPAYWSRVADHWLERRHLSDRLRKALWALHRAAALRPDDPQLHRSIDRLRQAAEAQA